MGRGSGYGTHSDELTISGKTLHSQQSVHARLRESSASMAAGVRTGYANHGRIDLYEAVSLSESESELSEANTQDPSVSGSQLS